MTPYQDSAAKEADPALSADPGDEPASSLPPAYSPKPGSLAIPIAATFILALSQLVSTSGRVWDVVSGSLVVGFKLHVPLWHLIFSPMNGFADVATALSLRQDVVVIAWFFLGYGVWRCFRLTRRRRIAAPCSRVVARELASFVTFLLCLSGLVAWILYGKRPMAYLTATDPEVLLVDFHSHTSGSWDGRKSFTWRENMRWHGAQGFNAGFITDHNRIESSVAAKESSPSDGGHGYVSLAGEEMSLWRQHIVLLGVKERVDPDLWDERELLRPFLLRARSQGLVVQLSLPEYWWHHWGKGLDRFFSGAVHGVEILNSSPRALDFPPAYQREIIERCRRENLYVVGISDNHGYGCATCAWNAMRIPGWRRMDPETLERAILAKLKTDGFHAAQVLSRYSLAPETNAALLLTPGVAAVALLRSLSPGQALSWTGWVWFVWSLRSRRQPTVLPRSSTERAAPRVLPARP